MKKIFIGLVIVLTSLSCVRNKNGYYYSAQFDTNEGPVTRKTTTTETGIDYYYQYQLNMNTDIYPY